MAEYLVCERWRLDLPEDSESRWFLDWALRQPKGVSRHITAGFLAYRSLMTRYGPRDIRVAHEYFGGIGAQSLIIRGLFRPIYHSAGDDAPVAVRHLKRALPWLTARQADAYAPDHDRKADLVGLDFGDLTAWRLQSGQPQRELLDRVLARQPRAIVLTDVACRRLHLQRARYEAVLGHGAGESYESYLMAMAAWIRETYGYGLLRGYMDRWSAVMAYVPLDQKPDNVLRVTPDQPVGLQLARAETPGGGR